VPIDRLFARSDAETETIRLIGVVWDTDFHQARQPLHILPARGGQPLRWPVK